MAKQIKKDFQPHTLVTGKYLGKKMRRFIMIVLISAFFIASPLVIFYTAGYRYDLIQRTIKQTGVLSVDIKPIDAEIYLNEVKIEKKIPIRLTNRAPGTYHIKIQKEGYKPWEKDITIQSNQTTFIKDVILLKNAAPQLIPHIPENTTQIFGSEFHDNFLILTQDENTYEIYIYNTRTQTTESLIRGMSVSQPQISVSPFQEVAYARFDETDDGSSILYLISLSNLEKPVVLHYNKPIYIQWSKTASDSPLFIQSENTIRNISLSGVQNIIARAVSSSIWYVDTNNHVWTYDTHTLNNLSTQKVYSLTQEPRLILDINEYRVITQSMDNKTFVYQPDKDRLTEKRSLPGTKIFYKRDTKEWWIWSDWELSSVYNDGGINLLERGGEKIKNAMLLDLSGVMLFVYDNKFASFNPGYYVRHELLQTDSTILDTFVNLRQRKIFYMINENGKNNVYALAY
ncbi:MAG: PEGA domain-containing protein [Candidatus Magasanikbacteria bacterium]